ncbi:AMP-binding protein [Glaciimonas sp. GG7]
MLDFSTNNSLVNLVMQHCDRSPDSPAIIGSAGAVTYGDLGKEIKRVSAHLQNRGIPVGGVVAIIQRNVPSAIAHILGTLHAGCIYCPVDPNADTERINLILEASNAIHCLTERSVVREHELKCHDMTLCEEVSSVAGAVTVQQRWHPVAYIMFTSGSTGVPKGVVIGHENLLSIYESWRTIYALDRIKSHLQLASLSFDVFAGDWIRALCSGAALYIPTDICHEQSEKLLAFITNNDIECAEFTPITLRKLYRYALSTNQRLDNFKILIAGSDVMHVSEFQELRRLLNGTCRLISSYGTTETTIDSLYFEPTGKMLNEMNSEDPLPIGRPFPSVEVAILNEVGLPVVAGEVGELYIGGAGVGHGYILHNARTAGRFLRRLPMGRSGRWYRTGDLASYNVGNIRLHGRADAQVKILGKTIDLTEIEYKLRNCSGVAECVATTIPDGLERKIVVLIKTGLIAGQLVKEKVFTYLSDHLEPMLIPSEVYVVSSLPMTVSGKIDRRAVHNYAVECAGDVL